MAGCRNLRGWLLAYAMQRLLASQDQPNSDSADPPPIEMVSPDQRLPFRWAGSHSLVGGDVEGVHMIVDPEDMKTGIQSPADADYIKFFDKEEVDSIDNSMHAGFTKLKLDSKRVDNSLGSLTEKFAKIPFDVTVDSELQKLKRDDANFEEDVQNTFSLLMLDSLSNTSGYCCCYRDLVNGDDPPTCRWNQATNKAAYFKQQGCKLLGLEDYHESMMTIDLDLNGTGNEALRSMQACGLVVQKALDMKSQSISSLFDKSTWQASSVPPSDILQHLNEREAAALKRKWPSALNKRAQALSKIDSFQTSCDLEELRQVLKLAYEAFLPPEDYTITVTRISECAEAVQIAKDVITNSSEVGKEIQSSLIALGDSSPSGVSGQGSRSGGSRDFAQDGTLNDSGYVDSQLPQVNGKDVSLLLALGNADGPERELKTAFDKVMLRRDKAKVDKEAMVQKFKSPEIKDVMNNQLRVWAKIVDAGMPAGKYESLLDAGLAGADTDVIQEAQAAATKRGLQTAVEKITGEMESDHREAADMQKYVEKIRAEKEAERKRAAQEAAERAQREREELEEQDEILKGSKTVTKVSGSGSKESQTNIEELKDEAGSKTGSGGTESSMLNVNLSSKEEANASSFMQGKRKDATDRGNEGVKTASEIFQPGTKPSSKRPEDRAMDTATSELQLDSKLHSEASNRSQTSEDRNTTWKGESSKASDDKIRTWKGKSSHGVQALDEKNGTWQVTGGNAGRAVASSFLQARSATQPTQETVEEWERICRTVSRIISANERYRVQGVQNLNAWQAWQSICTYYLPHLQEGRDEHDIPEETKTTLRRLMARTTGVPIHAKEAEVLRDELEKEHKRNVERVNGPTGSEVPLSVQFAREETRQAKEISIEYAARRPVEYSVKQDLSPKEFEGVLKKVQGMIGSSGNSLVSGGDEGKGMVYYEKRAKSPSLADVSSHDHGQSMSSKAVSAGSSLSAGFLQKNLTEEPSPAK